LRFSLGGSRKAEGRNCSSILLRLIVITKEEFIRHQEEEEEESRIEKLGKQKEENLRVQ
jgi:hypothetical protein